MALEGLTHRLTPQTHLLLVSAQKQQIEKCLSHKEDPLTNLKMYMCQRGRDLVELSLRTDALVDTFFFFNSFFFHVAGPVLEDAISPILYQSS